MSIKNRVERLEQASDGSASPRDCIMSAIPVVYQAPLALFLENATEQKWLDALEQICNCVETGDFSTTSLHFTVLGGVLWWARNALVETGETEHAQQFLEVWRAYQRHALMDAGQSGDTTAVEFIPWWVRKELCHDLDREMRENAQDATSLWKFASASYDTSAKPVYTGQRVWGYGHRYEVERGRSKYF